MIPANTQQIRGYTVLLGGEGGYRRLRAAQSGLYYWDLPSQQVLLRELGEFFPTVTEKDGCGVFLSIKKGHEICQGSVPLGHHRIPRDTIHAIERSLEQLQGHLQDPGLTPEARRLIEHLKFPDPSRLPEFYRQTTDGSIVIIWGCERTEKDSIPPLDALKKLPRETRVQEVWRKSKLALLALLLLMLIALLVGLYFAWPHAEIKLTKDTLMPGEVLAVDISGSKGNDATINWPPSASAVAKAPWLSSSLPKARVVRDGLKSFQNVPSPVELTFHEAGRKSVELEVSGTYLGLNLPKAKAQSFVTVTPRLDDSGGAVPNETASGNKSERAGFRVQVTSPPGVMPAVVTAVAAQSGKINFSGYGTKACSPGEPVASDAYKKPGVYRVDLLADKTPSSPDPAYVRIDPPDDSIKVIANLRLSKNRALPGETVVADSSGSYHREPNGSIQQRELSIDGGKSFEKLNGMKANITVQRSEPMDVVLRVTDNSGRISEDRENLLVENPAELNVTNLKQAISQGGNLYIPENLLFPSGSATISPKGVDLLRQFANTAIGSADQFETIEIIGHTDDRPVRSQAMFADNMALSKARAEAAAAILLAGGRLDPKLITTRGVGDTEPLVENSSDLNRAKNRRIQIKVVKKVLAIPDPTRP